MTGDIRSCKRIALTGPGTTHGHSRLLRLCSHPLRRPEGVGYCQQLVVHMQPRVHNSRWVSPAKRLSR